MTLAFAKIGGYISLCQRFPLVKLWNITPCASNNPVCIQLLEGVATQIYWLWADNETQEYHKINSQIWMKTPKFSCLPDSRVSKISSRPTQICGTTHTLMSTATRETFGYASHPHGAGRYDTEPRRDPFPCREIAGGWGGQLWASPATAWQTSESFRREQACYYCLLASNVQSLANKETRARLLIVRRHPI